MVILELHQIWVWVLELTEQEQTFGLQAQKQHHMFQLEMANIQMLKCI